MNSIRKGITGLVLAGAMVAAAGATLPAGAHAGHAAPMVKITRPAPGTMYVNDVAQGGSVDLVGDVAKPATSLGKSITISVNWECPPRSTGSKVSIKVRDANGTVVYNAGDSFGGPAGSRSTTWTTDKSGTYTIETSVSCHHWEQGPNGTTKVDDGGDADSRQVIVVTG